MKAFFPLSLSHSIYLYISISRFLSLSRSLSLSLSLLTPVAWSGTRSIFVLSLEKESILKWVSKLFWPWTKKKKKTQIDTSFKTNVHSDTNVCPLMLGYITWLCFFTEPSWDNEPLDELGRRASSRQVSVAQWVSCLTVTQSFDSSCIQTFWSLVPCIANISSYSILASAFQRQQQSMAESMQCQNILNISDG